MVMPVNQNESTKKSSEALESRAIAKPKPKTGKTLPRKLQTSWWQRIRKRMQAILALLVWRWVVALSKQLCFLVVHAYTWFFNETVPPKGKGVSVSRGILYTQAISMALLGTALLFVSIPHLQHGIMICTGVHDPFRAALLALFWDVAQIGAEVGLLLCSLLSYQDRVLLWVSRGVMLCCSFVSAVFNCIAFTSDVTNIYLLPLSVFLGCALPCLVLASFFMASKFTIIVSLPSRKK